ncbi:MAG: hypothetical protein GY750_03815 [Lentisphaerae bacterium]|nr:hypothetical protein [Lentisphaerota bacterium]MCP4100540.1 hypothetical protein [Lentisphaerota bacterium]
MSNYDINKLQSLISSMQPALNKMAKNFEKLQPALNEMAKKQAIINAKLQPALNEMAKKQATISAKLQPTLNEMVTIATQAEKELTKIKIENKFLQLNERFEKIMKLLG